MEEGLKEIDEAIRLNPQAALYRGQKATIYQLTGKGDEAIREFKAAVEVDPQFTGGRVRLIQALMQKKKVDEALAECRAGAKAEPKNPVYPNIEGAIHLSKKDVKEGERAFRKALEVNPKFKAARYNLAALRLSQNDSAKAREELSLVLKDDPADERALVMLGRLDEAEKKESEALARYKEAASKGKGIAGGRGDRPVSRIAGKDGGGGRRGQGGREPAPEGPASAHPPCRNAERGERVRRVAGHVGTGRRARAQEPAAAEREGGDLSPQERAGQSCSRVRGILALAPKQPALYGILAGTYFRSGNPDKAREAAKRAGKEFPKTAIEPEILADLAAAEKDLAGALKQMKEAVKREPKNPLLVQKTGAIQMARKEFGAAAGEFRKAIEMAPKAIPPRMGLASALEAQKKPKEAVAVYREILKIQPEYAPVLNNLAYLLAEQGENLKEAEEMIERARKQAPKDPSLMDTAGWVAYKRGNTPPPFRFSMRRRARRQTTRLSSIISGWPRSRPGRRKRRGRRSRRRSTSRRISRSRRRPSRRWRNCGRGVIHHARSVGRHEWRLYKNFSSSLRFAYDERTHP